MMERAQAMAGLIAGILAMLAVVPYIRSILSGRTKPNRASFLIWTGVGLMVAATYKASGATTTLWVALAYFVSPLIVAALSLKYGVGGASRLDLVCLSGALLSLALWWATRSAPTSLYINILVDALAVIPTAKKAWLDPGSEDRSAWQLAFLANAVDLFAIRSWAPEISIYPIYSFLATGTIVTALTLKRRPAPAVS